MIGLSKLKRTGSLLRAIASGRCTWSTTRHFKTNCLISADKSALRVWYEMEVTTALFSSYSEEQYEKGVLPWSSSKIIIPKAQTSVFIPYKCSIIPSGDIYNGDPISRSKKFWLDKYNFYLLVYLAKPKSAILHIPLWMKMFAIFRSLWTIPRSPKYKRPL